MEFIEYFFRVEPLMHLRVGRKPGKGGGGEGAANQQQKQNFTLLNQNPLCIEFQMSASALLHPIDIAILDPYSVNWTN